MHRSTRRLGAFSLVLLCAACGGRAAHPVSATTPYDDQLSCDHLTAERQVNDRRIADLNDESNQDVANSVGLVLVGGIGGAMLMDASHSETTERDALHARNATLDGLIAKKCAAAPAAAPSN